VATRAAPKNGISRAGSKNGFTTGSTVQVSFFGMPSPEADGKTPMAKTGKRARRRKVTKPGKTGNGKPTTQVSFVKDEPASTQTSGKKAATEAAGQPAKSGPTQRQVRLGQQFKPEQLSKLSVQLRLGLAAATRHVRILDSGAARDIGHGDPRPSDWARLDVRQFEILTRQLSKARREDGVMDLSSLKGGELVELWEFSRFEADRALRNIDHLQTPGTGIGGASAQYLVKNHKLEARFYTHLANQIESIFPAENIQAEYPTGTGGIS